MKIAVIGATGNTGRAIVSQALERGHAVTAIVRNREKATQLFTPQPTIIEKDAFDLSASDLENFDYVIDAFAAHDRAYLHLDLATKLVTMMREQPRPTLFFILGAASLKQEDGTPLLASILASAADEPWVATPIQQAHEYQYLQWIDNVNWTAVSPQRDFIPGPKTSYRLGGDHIMTNTAGKSTVTTGNLASTILDEIEHPTHLHKRFTVVDDD